MKITKIQKKYGKHSVLNDITLSAKPGTCVGILGGNGSGKSTLLSILAGVHKGDNGTFIFNDSDLLKNEKKRSEYVGYVPQNTPLFEELNAYDNLRLWYTKKDMDKAFNDGVLRILGISEFIKTPVYKMSGGMKKRLAIGCAVAHNPKILLLDEPSAALDLVCKERISNYLKDYKNNGGIIIIATHDIQELPLCDDLYILKNGTLESFDYDGNIHRLVGML